MCVDPNYVFRWETQLSINLLVGKLGNRMYIDPGYVFRWETAPDSYPILLDEVPHQLYEVARSLTLSINMWHLIFLTCTV